MLVEIQESRMPQNKSTSFLAPLECLELIEYPHDDPPRDAISGEIIPRICPDGSDEIFGFFRRSYHDVLDIQKNERRYIALSYTWHAAEGEDDTSGLWWVETKERNGYKLSPVRTVVLDRITFYMQRHGIKYLWIDQHCIVQTTTCASSSCEHPDCNEKRNAVHAMDLVYQLSIHPVALLSGFTMRSADIRVLMTLRFNRQYKWKPPLAPFVSPQAWRTETLRHARGAVKLLFNIISDPWWQRAWPFQENVLALWNMTLLWRLDASPLEGVYYSEHSKEFCKMAISLCLAVLRVARTGPALRKEEFETTLMAMAVLQTIKGSTKDSPGGSLEGLIVAGVERKGITDCWDRLAIIANCCRYGTRLEPLSLRDGGHSVSLSVLAMCLLNGEILDNWKMKPALDASRMSESQYLAAGLVNTRATSRSNECHFTEVGLTARGVHTRGHLWELGEVVRLNKITPHVACEVLRDGRRAEEMVIGKLTRWENARIRLYQCKKLVTLLESLGYLTLSVRLNEVFERPETTRWVTYGYGFPWDTDITRMSLSELISIIGTGEPIHVARLWQADEPGDDKSSYCALFAVHDRDDNEGLENYTAFPINPGQPLVFTSTKDPGPSFIDYAKLGAPWAEEWRYLGMGDWQNSYRYAAMAVELDELESEDDGEFESFGGAAPDQEQTPVPKPKPIPALRTRGWRCGMCFPGDTPPREVVFPWPKELLDIRPGTDKGAEENGASGLGV